MGANDDRSITDMYKQVKPAGWPMKYKILAGVVVVVVLFALVANLAG